MRHLSEGLERCLLNLRHDGLPSMKIIDSVQKRRVNPRWERVGGTPYGTQMFVSYSRHAASVTFSVTLGHQVLRTQNALLLLNINLILVQC